MSNILKYEDVKDKVLTLRNQQVILNCDIAQLYGVETREINQAVKNNPDKFPSGYLFQLDNQEFANLKSKILTSSWGGARKLPTAFTERGLHMLKTQNLSQQTLTVLHALL